VVVGASTTVVFWPIATAIAISIITGAALNAIDEKYQLTEKLIAALDQCAKEFAKKRDELEQTLGRTYHEAERELMWRGYGFDVDNPNIK
jgi:hypothetical protein